MNTDYMRINQTKNMHEFTQQHETLSNEQLREIYHTLTSLSRFLDDNAKHEMSEYYRVQCDAISSILLFIRFNDDIDKYLKFIDKK